MRSPLSRLKRAAQEGWSDACILAARRRYESGWCGATADRLARFAKSARAHAVAELSDERRLATLVAFTATMGPVDAGRVHRHHGAGRRRRGDRAWSTSPLSGPTGVFHALPVSRGKSVVDSHWIQEMVTFYGLDIFLAETSATCGGLDSLLEPTGPLRQAPTARGGNVRFPADVLGHQRHLHREQDLGPGAGQAGRHRVGRPQLSPVPSLRAGAGRRPGLLSGRLPAQRVLDVRGGTAARDQSNAAGAAQRQQVTDTHTAVLPAPGPGAPQSSTPLPPEGFAGSRPRVGDQAAPGDEGEHRSVPRLRVRR